MLLLLMPPLQVLNADRDVQTARSCMFSLPTSQRRIISKTSGRHICSTCTTRTAGDVRNLDREHGRNNINRNIPRACNPYCWWWRCRRPMILASLLHKTGECCEASFCGGAAAFSPCSPPSRLSPQRADINKTIIRIIQGKAIKALPPQVRRRRYTGVWEIHIIGLAIHREWRLYCRTDFLKRFIKLGHLDSKSCSSSGPFSSCRIWVSASAEWRIRRLHSNIRRGIVLLPS
jgi:hypothetical protein